VESWLEALPMPAPKTLIVCPQQSSIALPAVFHAFKETTPLSQDVGF